MGTTSSKSSSASRRYEVGSGQQQQYPPQPSTPQPSPWGAPPQQEQQQSQWGARPPTLQQSPTMRFKAIADTFNSMDQVQEALRREGLESSNLIVAVDFTKSNEWTGKRSFDGRSLHTLGASANPYEEAISILGRTLRAFDDDGLIPSYGFGDATTRDNRVFSFMPGDAPCASLDDVLHRYRELVPNVRLAGPTSFAPAIEQAVKVCVDSGCQYHILLIVADGQVTRSSDTNTGQMSPQEQATVQAIVAASQFPLSIIMVGVGDGPWDVMREFDDALPQRQFDNFQFVNFTETWGRYKNDPRKLETMFALRALMEVPEQFKTIQKLGILGRPSSLRLQITPLNPPGPPPMPHGMSAHPQAYAAAAAPLTRPSYPPIGGVTSPHSSGQATPGYAVPAHNPYGVASGSGAAAPTAPAFGSAAFHQAGGSTSSKGGLGGTSFKGEADPPLYMCPITQEMMADPVLAADGYSYERSAIVEWLARHNTSPMTNANMPHTQLTPNHALRSSILEYRQRTGI